MPSNNANRKTYPHFGQFMHRLMNYRSVKCNVACRYTRLSYVCSYKLYFNIFQFDTIFGTALNFAFVDIICKWTLFHQNEVQIWVVYRLYGMLKI